MTARETVTFPESTTDLFTTTRRMHVCVGVQGRLLLRPPVDIKHS